MLAAILGTLLLSGDTLLTARLAAAPLPVQRTRVSVLQTDSLGGIMAATVAGPDLIVAGENTPLYRFDLQTGRLLKTLTSVGDGPGEVRSPLYLATLPGDSIFLYDQSLRRVTIYQPRTFSVARTTAVPGRNPTEVIPVGNRILIAARIVPGEGIGQPLHEYSYAGDWIRSYGHVSGRVLNTRDESLYRRATQAYPNGVWSISRQGNTVLEMHDGRGRLVSRITYSPEAELTTGPPGPKRLRAGLWQAAPGLVWILTWVPDPDWKEGARVLRPDVIHGPAPIAIEDRPKLWDSVLDAVNTRTGEIVARVRVDGWVSHLLSGGYLVIEEESRDGELRVVVERLAVGRPRNPPR